MLVTLCFGVWWGEKGRGRGVFVCFSREKSASIWMIVARKPDLTVYQRAQEADRDQLSNTLTPLRRHAKTKTAATRYQYT